jgi:hypothetical protein
MKKTVGISPGVFLCITKFQKCWFKLSEFDKGTLRTHRLRKFAFLPSLDNNDRLRFIYH